MTHRQIAWVNLHKLYGSAVAVDIFRGLFRTHPSRSELSLTKTQAENQDLYFITDGHAVKIGIAGNIQARKATLQTSHYNQLKVLVAVEYGGRELETYYHNLFKADRIRGEWFTISSSIINEVKWLAANNYKNYGKFNSETIT